MPRLILAQRGATCGAATPPDSHVGLSPDQVIEVANLSLAQDVRVLTSYVEALSARGTPVETLYLDLLAPAARRLGELWAADLCSFSEVTLGLMRLHQVMRVLSPTFQIDGFAPQHDHQILLTPVPGEQHSFGLFMVAEFFHRAGWEIWSGPVATIDDLADAVHARWFAVAGLSVSSDAKLDELVTAIRVVRRKSLNRAIGVMVGGHLFTEHPEMAAMVGADATAADSPRAVLQAQGLLDLRTECG